MQNLLCNAIVTVLYHKLMSITSGAKGKHIQYTPSVVGIYSDHCTICLGHKTADSHYVV